MQDDQIIRYLNIVESAFSKLESGYFERYEEEILTPERVNIRIRVRFPNVYILEWNEAVIAVKGHIDHLSYRYHFQDSSNKLIFRYDNTPHFPELNTYPNHKHIPDNVVPSGRPSAVEIIEEVNKSLI